MLRRRKPLRSHTTLQQRALDSRTMEAPAASLPTRARSSAGSISRRGGKRTQPSKWPVVDGIRRIADPSNPRGYREVCLTDAAWKRNVSIARARAGNVCERCRVNALDADPHHKRGRGAGKRDDHPDALKMLCRTCHDTTHSPKAVPRKRRENDGEGARVRIDGTAIRAA